jgi:carbamoyl-phosphate synthase small subunit
MSHAPSLAAAPTAGLFSRGALVLSDGTTLEGQAFGAPLTSGGEICFNTAMTGYQEILSDPSYAGQIVAFTFPHIGIVGTNDEDLETLTPVVRGLIVRADARQPSNYRSLKALDRWLKVHNIPALAGVDTRALTARIRAHGMVNGLIVPGDSADDRVALIQQARALPSMEGLDLAKGVSAPQPYRWSETPWAWSRGYAQEAAPSWRVTVVDYGVKRNILRMLAGLGADITVVPAETSFDDIMRQKPDGVLLSNGPGDPVATGIYAIPTIRNLVENAVPTFGICLGHQMLGLALGAKTKKMLQGHHGANHPVKDLNTG